VKGVVMFVKGSDEVNKMKTPVEINYKVVFFNETKMTEDLKAGDIIYWWDELCVVTGERFNDLVHVVPYSNLTEDEAEVYSERHTVSRSYISSGIDIPVVKYFIPVSTI
jgi:hypothetical protein